MAILRAILVSITCVTIGVGVAGCKDPAEECDKQRTRESCEKGCDAGDAKSCHRLARILDDMPHLDPELAKAAFQRSCELGSAYGCTGRRSFCLGARDEGEPLSESEQECYQQYSKLACDNGDQIACRQIPKDDPATKE